MNADAEIVLKREGRKGLGLANRCLVQRPGYKTSPILRVIGKGYRLLLEELIACTAGKSMYVST